MIAQNVQNGSKFAAMSLMILWGIIQPALPFVGICVALVFVDCFTAWRLSRRVKKAYPNGCDGKFKSKHAKKMFGDLLVISVCIVLFYWIDKLFEISFLQLHMVVCEAFAGVEALSILENESSCNGSRWAKVAQRFVVDKTERHLNYDFNGDGQIGVHGLKDDKDEGE